MPNDYDVAIIGGGPAGLMAAVFAAARGLRVVILEKNAGLPKKLLITGKGRCNVCNNCAPEDFLANVRRGARFLNSCARGFTAADIMAFFEDRGVALVTERGARVFPKSGKSRDIAEALYSAAKQAGAVIETTTASSILTYNGAVSGVTLGNNAVVRCAAALLATGGASYPKTGSTGDGYRMAAALGHEVRPPKASLVSIVCRGGDCARLEGLSLRNVGLVAQTASEKPLFSELGELVFTADGISGPLALSLSAHLVGLNYAELRLWVDLKPALDSATLDARLLRDFKQNSNRQFKNSLSALLPKSLIPVVVGRSGIEPEKSVNAITAAERAALLKTLKRLEFEPLRPGPLESAVVTAGGVSPDQIDPKTMQSKLVKNLYFAGELIDADAYTGGFNLMIAFATGAAAGKHILEGDIL